jgi:hypothetical protein
MKTKSPDGLGRDELNLAEFPLGLVSERIPKSLTSKTLTFEGQFGRLILTGSDAFGLPTALDSDVIVALMYMTKVKNNFTDPTVYFSRYELLGILGKQDKGQTYKRLSESLNRWMGVTLYYDSSFWNNKIKCRIDAKFHILESVILISEDARKTLRSRQQPLPLSSFSWNRVFFESCQANNLKKLDLGVYFALRSAVTKQLYRFLDKRFYLRPDWEFSIRELAFGHVGLSPNYTDSKIKEKLQPALEELEQIGFILQMSNKDRYRKVRRGDWRIRLVRAGNSLSISKRENRQGELTFE